MRVILAQDWQGLDRDEGFSRLHKAGETLRVYHVAGIRLINRRLAKWIRQDQDDPPWEPIEQFRHKALTPEHNRMITGGVNK